MVDDEETTFEMSQKQTVLDAALKQGIDAVFLPRNLQQLPGSCYF
jgi:ferredoxin